MIRTLLYIYRILMELFVSHELVLQNIARISLSALVFGTIGIAHGWCIFFESFSKSAKRVSSLSCSWFWRRTASR